MANEIYTSNTINFDLALENAALRARVVELLTDALANYEQENARLRELIREMDIEHGVGWWSRSVRDRIDEALERKP